MLIKLQPKLNTAIITINYSTTAYQNMQWYEGHFLSSYSRAVFLKPLEISKFYLSKTFKIYPVCLHTHFTPIYPFPERRLVVLFRFMLQTLVDRTAYTTTDSKRCPASISFSLGNNQKSKGDRSGLYGR